MCNGLEDHIEINERVVGKIPKSVNGQLYSLLWYGPLFLEGVSEIFKTTKQMGYIHIHRLFYY